MAHAVENVGANTHDAGFAEVLNPTGSGGYVIACDHASNFVPDEFSSLGLDGDALQSHIAWDLGARAVGVHLSGLLDAPMIAPVVSRLVCDCNRVPGAISAVPAKSEIYEIPGNASVDDGERERRRKKYCEPFHDAIDRILDRKAESGGAVFVTLHSFTPVYEGRSRATEIGIIHDSDSRLADELLNAARGEGEYMVELNSPYGPEDGVTFTIVEHGVLRKIPNVMIEIRNDLISDDESQKKMAVWLAKVIQDAVRAAFPSVKQESA